MHRHRHRHMHQHLPLLPTPTHLLAPAPDSSTWVVRPPRSPTSSDRSMRTAASTSMPQRCMHLPCMATCMPIACPLHAHCMPTAWPLHVHCMATAWPLHGHMHAHCMPTAWPHACPLHALWHAPVHQVAAHFDRLGRPAPPLLWEEDRDGDGRISSDEFSGCVCSTDARLRMCTAAAEPLQCTFTVGTRLRTLRRVDARRRSAPAHMRVHYVRAVCRVHYAWRCVLHSGRRGACRARGRSWPSWSARGQRGSPRARWVRTGAVVVRATATSYSGECVVRAPLSSQSQRRFA